MRPSKVGGGAFPVKPKASVSFSACWNFEFLGMGLASSTPLCRPIVMQAHCPFGLQNAGRFGLYPDWMQKIMTVGLPGSPRLWSDRQVRMTWTQW